MARKQVSEGRKAVYYVGLLLMIIGFLCFGSVFVSGARHFDNSRTAHFGDFSNFQKQSRSEMTRAIVGMSLMIVGGIMMTLGKMGIAGSGAILDPERARKDIEPWSRMGGGVLKDALDEAGIFPEPPAPMGRLPFDEQLRRLQAPRRGTHLRAGV